jgi:hypothetical protein
MLQSGDPTGGEANRSPMGLSHRSQRFAARPRQQQQTPTGLPRPVNKVLELAHEPLLQTGQARLGARFALPRSSL